jgi:hypothetical protein
MFDRQESKHALASKETAMINKYVAMGLGAFIALAPVAAVAQEQVAQADTTTAAPMATPAPHATRGSHRRHTRRQARTAAHHARASAHHMHKMSTAPAEAPKS